MWSFSEFAYCCGLSSSAVSPASDPPITPSTATIQIKSGAINDPLKRKSRSSRIWRPSLSVISEDGIVSHDDSNRRGQKETLRIRKEASKSIATDKDTYPVYGGINGSKRKTSDLSMAMPVFSPTPFMF